MPLIDRQNHTGCTPLMETFKRIHTMKSKERIILSKLLLEAGADTNVSLNNGKTTLMLAIAEHSFNGYDALPMVKLLIKYGADPNQTADPNRSFRYRYENCTAFDLVRRNFAGHDGGYHVASWERLVRYLKSVTDTALTTREFSFN